MPGQLCFVSTCAKYYKSYSHVQAKRVHTVIARAYIYTLDMHLFCFDKI